MNRLSVAIAVLLFLAYGNHSLAATDQELPSPIESYSAAVKEGANAVLKHDYASALAKLRPLAAAGDANAQLIVGVLYRDGLGVKQDNAQAIAWIRKAADQNLPAAQRTLGNMYFEGEHEDKNEAQAAMLYLKKAADQGDSRAQADLGSLYEWSHEVPNDLAQALSLYQKSADQGDAFGENNLGWMYHSGHGVPKDDAKALEWLRKSAQKGDLNALNNLGVMYRKGDGVPRDDATALEWFRKSADQGSAFGENNLGWMYQEGTVVPRDYAQALAWFRKSAAQGNADAENNLGVMYRDGDGVPKDDATALDWFRKSAEQGSAFGENNLGWMYHEGTVVPRDYAQALAWYRKSAAQGDGGAENNLGWSYQRGDGVPKDAAIARQWYEKAVAHGNDRAKANLAAMNPFNTSVSKRLANAAFARSLMGGATTTAGASVLKDDIVYTVAADGTYTMDENTQLRVNLAQSVQQWGQTYLPYSSSLEELKVLEAYTISKDGKRIDVTPDKIIDQQSPISTSAPSFSDVQIKAIVFPAVEPGATVAYHVIRTVKHPLFAGQFSMIEHFPTVYEIKDSRVTLIAPKSLPLHVEAIGMQGGEVPSDKAGTSKWVWTLNDASQGVAEVGSIDPRDYSPRVAATSFADYPAAAKAYADGADPKAKVTPNVRKLADQITQGITDPHAKAVAIYNWVSHNIRYVSLTFGLGGVVPHDSETILAARYGDCKDHVVLLQALLSAVGIPSSPVLVNAASVYWQPQIAMSPGVFDHAITYIPKFDVFVDSTAEVAPFGVLPPTEAGKPALVARGRDGKPALVHLPLGDGKRDIARTTLTATMTEDGSVIGATVYADTGLFELLDRLVAWHVPGGQESQVAGALLSQFGAPGTGTLALGDARDLSKPYTYSSSFNISGYANVPGPGNVTMPVGIPGMSGIVGFPRETVIASRTHPIACLAARKIEDSTLTLPASIKIKQLPPAVHLANDISHYDATYVQTGQSIRAHRELLLTPKAALCSPQEYQQMRALGEAIARDFRAQVVY